MNEISEEKKMTVKEVAEVLNVSTDLIKKRIRELYPDKMQNGKTTYLNELEVTLIKMRIAENSSLATYDDHHRLVDMPKTELEEEMIVQQAMRIQQNKVLRLQEENQQLQNENNNQKQLISGLTEDITLHDKVSIINRVLRAGEGSISERYSKVYKVFKEQAHIDLPTRCNNYNKKQRRQKDKLSTIRYAEKFNHIDSLYKYISKLYIEDVEKIKSELGI